MRIKLELIHSEFSRFLQTDADYEKAINECQIIKQSAFFSQGVLLKCIDHKPLFPYLHLAQFHWQDQTKRIYEIGEKIRECGPDPRSFYGSYDEISSLCKTAVVGEPNLPTNRHAGYIVIAFKLLDDANKQQNLEKTWLNWSGAREIYKHSPRNWNLRKISLLKHPFVYKNGANRPFAYILLCEYGSILHPANTIQALDICERLRTRNCGLVALYQVHTAYSNEAPSAPSSSVVSARRYPMSRGFSEDVVEVIKRESPRRAPRLRSRERSLQIADEHFYQPYQMQ
ncbi:hypothetical protein WR25_12487 [Diploscapter pachys]|uniref:DUF7153 domain-containing protein n=1 Tax=Diploscapter pachys TaxID=2018661 RepID=A0A2A2KDH7_9BILA|nr:hypothetical protein WR25_12487 [Diploscapter pachys]